MRHGPAQHSLLIQDIANLIAKNKPLEAKTTFDLLCNHNRFDRTAIEVIVLNIDGAILSLINQQQFDVAISAMDVFTQVCDFEKAQFTQAIEKMIVEHMKQKQFSEINRIIAIFSKHIKHITPAFAILKLIHLKQFQEASEAIDFFSLPLFLLNEIKKDIENMIDRLMLQGKFQEADNVVKILEKHINQTTIGKRTQKPLCWISARKKIMARANDETGISLLREFNTHQESVNKKRYSLSTKALIQSQKTATLHILKKVLDYLGDELKTLKDEMQINTVIRLSQLIGELKRNVRVIENNKANTDLFSGKKFELFTLKEEIDMLPEYKKNAGWFVAAEPNISKIKSLKYIADIKEAVSKAERVWDAGVMDSTTSVKNQR